MINSPGTTVERLRMGRPDTTPMPRAIVLLAAAWLIAMGLLSVPELSLSLRALVLAVPALLSVLVALVTPASGFHLWTLGFLALVTQTGYQLDIGPVRVSALEAAIAVLLGVYVWLRRFSPGFAASSARLPAGQWLALFACYALARFIIGLVQGHPWELAVVQLKGFLLYPALALLIATGVRTKPALRWLIGGVLAWYALVAGYGLWQFARGDLSSLPLDGLVRVTAGYAPINIYGITLAAMALLALGLARGLDKARLKTLAFLLAVWLFCGATAAGARTVWVAATAAILTGMAVAGPRRRSIIPILFLAAMVAILLLAPPATLARLLQLSDSSTALRWFYLTSGLEALCVNWLLGWGWGQAYWFEAGRLVPTGSIPWYHNDYLNLAVQTGVPGTMLYAVYWLQSLRLAGGVLKSGGDTELQAYVLGTRLALLTLLFAACFEHVLWRPDIGGLVGLMSGLMLASTCLLRQAAAGQAAP